VAVRGRNDGVFKIVSADLDNAATAFSLDDSNRPGKVDLWSNYVRGMVDGLIQDGAALRGADIAIMGDMPRGTGLSSSAALEMASGLALATLSGRPNIDRNVLAKLGQRTEHEFAGCKCGIMDQLISASAIDGAAMLIDCRTLEAHPVPIPDDWAIMIVQSGIERGLVDGEYNDRRAQCERAAAHFGVAALRDVETLPVDTGLDPVVLRRARHVVTENARTLAAAQAMTNGDLRELGVLMRASHASMRDDFEVSLPTIDRLQQILSAAIGEAGGARLTGGGFGGAVVAVMPRDLVETVRAAVLGAYRTPDNQPPTIMIERPAAGALLL
jgi:galactokinase